MGHRNWHLERAKHNKKASDFLVDNYDDWALIALFYSALHYVHSSLADERTLPKDERHPRKHSAPAGDDYRGVNQLVRDVFPEINLEYRSLFELSYRTRYDVHRLGPMAVPLAQKQWQQVRDFCVGRNQGRPALPSRDV